MVYSTVRLLSSSLFKCYVWQDDEQMLLLQVVGVSGRRPERRAGVLPVMTPMKTEMKLKQKKDPATETIVQTGGPDRWKC